MSVNCVKLCSLFLKLKQLSGLTGRTVTPETEILKIFGFQSTAELLEPLGEFISNEDSNQLSTIVYAGWDRLSFDE